MKKRVLSMLVCAVSLSIVFSGNVYAQETGGLIVEEHEQIEPVDIGDAVVVDLPSAAALSDTPEGEEIQLDFDANIPDISNVPSGSEEISIQARSGNQDFHFTGTINEAGGMYTIYPITLYNNQNIHAELVGPSNNSLNYALALYEMNTSTGALTALVDSCTYATNSAIPQTISTINRSSGAKSYALIVLARTGYSATDSFDVNITLGIGGDPGESNDNAYTAYNLGTLTEQGIRLSGTTLDSPKDVDWFVFSAPDLSEFSGIKINNANSSSVKYQLYYAVGSTMVESTPVNGVFPLSKGMNYLRVTDAGNNFSSGDVSYLTEIPVSFAATQAAYKIKMDKYDTLPDQTYEMVYENENGEVMVGETRYAVLGGHDLTWTATYLSKSGYLCTEAQDTLHIGMTNMAWDNPNMQSVSGTGKAKNGVAEVTVECLQSFGQIKHSVPPYSYIWADYSCTLTMYSEEFGSFFENGSTQPIFITSKIFS